MQLTDERKFLLQIFTEANKQVQQASEVRNSEHSLDKWE